MHYFKRNIGEYHKKAGRLTILQHGVYMLLMDACYDRERFPTFEDATDWCWAQSDEEIAALKFVLSKFFELIDGVYVQNRIQEEIAEYHDKALTNKKIAIDREEKRRGERRNVEHEPCTNRSPVVHEPPPKQEPRTINQEPENNNQRSKDLSQQVVQQDKPAKKTEFDYSQWPAMPSDQTMIDWLAMRKRLKAPISQTVINRFAVELKKAKAYGYSVDQCLAECVTRGWRGFETQWLVNSSQNGQYKTAAEKAADRNATTFDYEKARDF